MNIRPRNGIGCFLSMLAFFVLQPAVLQAQSRGAIAGLVTDRTGGGIAKARVTVDGPSRRTAVGDRDGTYRIGGLDPGAYSITFEKEGFSSLTQTGVIVKSGDITRHDAQLELAPVEERVDVEEERALSLDPREGAGAIVLRGEDLEALPDDPEEMAEALQALAGPAAGPSGGQIFIDGLTSGRLPSKSSIREIRINSNPFSAEFDRMGFGRIEILTKPGTDRFRGNVAFRFNDESLNSRNPFASNRPAYQMRDWDVNVEGALIPGKASFFVNLDRRDVDDNDLINATLLDSSLNVVPYNLAVTTPQHRTRLDPRIDLQIGSRHTLSLRYSYSDSESPLSGIGEYSLLSRAYESASREHAWRLTDTVVLAKSVANETRVQYERERRSQLGDNTIPTIQVLDSFIGGGSQVGDSSNREERLEIHNITSWSYRKHTLRAGLRIRGARVVDVSRQNFGGTLTFSGGTGPLFDENDQAVLDDAGQSIMTSLTSLERYRRTLVLRTRGLTGAEIRALGGGASQLRISGGQPEASVTQWDVAPFVQDDWNINQSFALSFGLRYENQTNIESRWNLAPRISLTWAARKGEDGRPRTVVRGGFGVFYDRVGQDLTLQAKRYDGVHQQQFLVTSPDILDQIQLYYDGVWSLPSVETLAEYRLPQAIRRVAPDLQTPITYQSSVSVEQALPQGFTLSAILVSTNVRRMLRSRNVNAPLPGTGEYPLGTTEAVYQYESTGRLNQTQLILGLNNRLSRTLGLFARYFLGRARSDTDGAGSFPADQYDLSGEYGPAGMDVRHRFTLGGSVRLPWDLRLSPFVLASSGRPYNITTGRDLNGDTVFTDRPAYATDPDEPGVIATPYGLLDPEPEPGDAIIPRNLGRGPGFVMFNLRLNKTLAFGRRQGTSAPPPEAGGPGMMGPGGPPRGGFGGRGGRRGGPFGESAQGRVNLSFSVNVSNVLNHVNAGPPVGNLSSPQFGQATSSAGGFGFGRGGGPSAAGNRRIDLQARIGF